MRALAVALLVAWLRAASSNPKHPGDTKTDYYKLLKLKKGFSEKELKTAYRNAAKKYHPDKNVGQEEAARTIFEHVQSPWRERHFFAPKKDGRDVGGFREQVEEISCTRVL